MTYPETKNDVKFDMLPELAQDMKLSLREMMTYRMKMGRSIAESAGANYGQNGSVKAPVNLLAIYERALIGHLTGGDPRMMASTFDNRIRPHLDVLEKDANRQLREMNYRAILERTVRSAFHGFGIQRVAITAPAQSRFSYEQAVGRAGICNIDVEDFVCDMRGKLFGECGYLGHLYPADFEYVKKSKLFNAEARKSVQPAQDNLVNQESKDDRLMALGRGPMDEGFEKVVYLWEIYLPHEGIVVTFDADGDYQTPLLTQKWIGPKCGPYHFLGFDQVTGNLLPKGPAMDVYELHDRTNKHWGKLDNQATKQKSVVAYLKAEDASKAQEEKDGGFVQTDNPDWMQEKMVHSGPNQNVIAWVMNGMNTFSEMAGNLRAWAGLASQADTATQEKLIHSSASALVQSQGHKVFQFVQSVMRSYSWFLWRDPNQSLKSTWSPAGLPDIQLNRELEPLDRFGVPFNEQDIEINIHSMMTQTPAMKMALIDSVIKNDIIPVLPLFGQPGVGEMLAKGIRLKAHLANCPELEQLVDTLLGVQGPPMGATAPSEPGMPSETTRTNVRISQPGMNEDAHRQILQQAMMGLEPAEGAQGNGLGQMLRA